MEDDFASDNIKIVNEQLSEISVRINGEEQKNVSDSNEYHVNVKKYGAKGNGSTDDSRCIQEALEVAINMGKGLYFPPGMYITDGISIDHINIEIFGENMNNTFLCIRSDSKNDILSVDTCEILFHDITLNGGNMKYNKQGGNGLVITGSCWNSQFYNFKIINCRKNGIWIPSYKHSWSYIIRDFVIDSCIGWGIKVSGTDNYFSHFLVRHCMRGGMCLTSANVKLSMGKVSAIGCIDVALPSLSISTYADAKNYINEHLIPEWRDTACIDQEELPYSHGSHVLYKKGEEIPVGCGVFIQGAGICANCIDIQETYNENMIIDYSRNHFWGITLDRPGLKIFNGDTDVNDGSKGSKAEVLAWNSPSNCLLISGNNNLIDVGISPGNNAPNPIKNIGHFFFSNMIIENTNPSFQNEMIDTGIDVVNIGNAHALCNNDKPICKVKLKDCTQNNTYIDHSLDCSCMGKIEVINLGYYQDHPIFIGANIKFKERFDSKIILTVGTNTGEIQGKFFYRLSAVPNVNLFQVMSVVNHNIIDTDYPSFNSKTNYYIGCRLTKSYMSIIIIDENSMKVKLQISYSWDEIYIITGMKLTYSDIIVRFTNGDYIMKNLVIAYAPTEQRLFQKVLYYMQGGGDDYMNLVKVE